MKINKICFTVTTMSKPHSPAVFNGGSDNYYDPNFTLDINQKMTVPKSIRVSGDYSDDDSSSINGNNNWNQAIPADKFDMNVPDRILVVGMLFLLINIIINTLNYIFFYFKFIQVKINILAQKLHQLK